MPENTKLILLINDVIKRISQAHDDTQSKWLSLIFEVIEVELGVDALWVCKNLLNDHLWNIKPNTKI